MEFGCGRNLVYSVIRQGCDRCPTTGKISSFRSTSSETLDLSLRSAWRPFQPSACPRSPAGQKVRLQTGDEV